MELSRIPLPSPFSIFPSPSPPLPPPPPPFPFNFPFHYFSFLPLTFPPAFASRRALFASSRAALFAFIRPRACPYACRTSPPTPFLPMSQPQPRRRRTTLGVAAAVSGTRKKISDLWTA